MHHRPPRRSGFAITSVGSAGRVSGVLSVSTLRWVFRFSVWVYTLSFFPSHLDQDQWLLQISKVPQEKPAGRLDQKDSANRLSK